MITFDEECYGDVIEEIKPMLYAQYEEVEMYQDKIPLDPDYEKLQEMSDLDILRTYIMRADGKIVGYSVFFLYGHQHHKAHRFAANDVVYIDPEHRHGLATVEFFNFCERKLIKAGTSVVMYHMKEHKPFHNLMTQLEFDHAEHLYTKYIGQ